MLPKLLYSGDGLFEGCARLPYCDAGLHERAERGTGGNQGADLICFHSERHKLARGIIASAYVPRNSSISAIEASASAAMGFCPEDSLKARLARSRSSASLFSPFA